MDFYLIDHKNTYSIAINTSSVMEDFNTMSFKISFSIAITEMHFLGCYTYSVLNNIFENSNRIYKKINSCTKIIGTFKKIISLKNC